MEDLFCSWRLLKKLHHDISERIIPVIVKADSDKLASYLLHYLPTVYHDS